MSEFPPRVWLSEGALIGYGNHKQHGEYLSLAGAAWKEAQLLGLLRSEEANKEEDRRKECRFPNQWANWLEKKLKGTPDGEG